jgi:hypothetical protein
MSHRSVFNGRRARTVLAAACVLWVSAIASTAAHAAQATATMSNFQIDLVDLDITDGIDAI